MATNAYVQFPAAVETLKVRATPTFQYAVAAAMFGMVFGATIAATFATAPSLMGALNSGSDNSNAASVTSAPVAQSVHSSSVQTPAGKQSTKKAGSSVSTPAVGNSATHKRHAFHSASARMRFAAWHKASHHRSHIARPAIAPVQPSPSQTATPNDVAKSYAFFVEGDVTIADYNASTGTIETNDGRSFTIDTTVDATNAKVSLDYFGSVHYRCDQGGNCSLRGGGMVVPSAKMTS